MPRTRWYVVRHPKKKREQEKLIATASKNSKNGATMITYTYDGELMIANLGAAKEKLGNVVLTAKYVPC